jgi:hypothetical protein
MKAGMPTINDEKKLKQRPRPELFCPQEPLNEAWGGVKTKLLPVFAYAHWAARSLLISSATRSKIGHLNEALLPDRS